MEVIKPHKLYLLVYHPFPPFSLKIFNYLSKKYLLSFTVLTSLTLLTCHLRLYSCHWERTKMKRFMFKKKKKQLSVRVLKLFDELRLEHNLT